MKYLLLILITFSILCGCNSTSTKSDSNYIKQPVEKIESTPTTTPIDLEYFDFIHRTVPEYPRSLRRKRIEGTVHFSVIINSDGTVKDVKILSSDHELMSKAVIDAVLTWRVVPRKNIKENELMYGTSFTIFRLKKEKIPNKGLQSDS